MKTTVKKPSYITFLADYLHLDNDDIYDSLTGKKVWFGRKYRTAADFREMYVDHCNYLHAQHDWINDLEEKC